MINFNKYWPSDQYEYHEEEECINLISKDIIRYTDDNKKYQLVLN